METLERCNFSSSSRASFNRTSSALTWMPDIFAVTTYFDSSWNTLLGASNIATLDIQ